MCSSSLNHVTLFVSLLIPTCAGSEAIPYTFSRDWAVQQVCFVVEEELILV